MPVLRPDIENASVAADPFAGPDPVPGRLFAPILRLAGRLKVLAALAGAIAVAALAMAAAGMPRAALAGAAISGTLGLLALLTRVAALGHERTLGRHLRDARATFERDGDPIVFTTVAGRVLACNARSRSAATPVDWLRDWCVDPEARVREILHDVRASGGWAHDFFGDLSALHVAATLFRPGADLVVWRFRPLRLMSENRFDSIDAPVISRDGDGLRLNTAAARLAPVAAWEGVLSTRDAATSLVTLWDGQTALAVTLGRRLGGEDILIVPRPAAALPGPDGADFEDIPVALLRIGPDGRIAGSNRIARQLLALDGGEERYFWQVVEGLGRPVADWLEDARAGRALGRPEVVRACLAARETFVQVILRRADGVGANGGLVAVISDATELKSLEARFVQSQKMQAIGQLAGGIAHDFNNLLTAISGHCDLLLMNRDRFDPDYNDLLQIHQNANRAAALVRQLLAFSRKQTMKTEVVNLESLLEELTHLLTRLVGERISLQLTHDPDLCAIRADKRQLEQVLVNLVVNARDAMPMGGTIRIVTERVCLADELEVGRARIPPGDYARIRVIDEGLGIPAAIIDKIFEPFFTTKRQGEGTGLGLSTAYGIVKQMGGFIFAKSVEGSGTEFTLYFAGAGEAATAATSTEPAAPVESRVPATLPAAAPDAVPAAADLPPAAAGQLPADAPASPEAPARAPLPARSGTILLVEDEAPVRAFAARALRLQGYQVFEVPDGEQALEFLADLEHQIDLFVTDVIMPGIDGPGWVTEALQTRPGTPVVFMSGYTEDTVSAALKTVPRSAFLGKPFSLQELTETIDALTGR